MWRSLLLLVLAAAPAHAQAAAPEPIALEYTAPGGCPDADAFFAGVRARANAVRAAHAERLFRVAISADRGTLDIVAGDGTTTREVTGATCAETASALALVAALAIENRVAAPTPVPPAPVAVPWTASVGAGFGRYDGIAPSAAYAIPAFVAIGRGHVWFRLGVAVTERVAAEVPTGSVDFRWTIGRVEACPYVLVWDRFGAAACAGFEAGTLAGRGDQVAMPTSDVRPWLAPDAAARVTVRVGRAAVELEGLIAAPLVRDRFFIAPSTTVHAVPAVTTGVSAGLAFAL
jgi:hypothetical protein